jgi:glucose-1-phosphate thymidylyltransferase
VSQDLTRAVVLAAGRGARMRAAAPGLPLDAAQAHAADRGLKALVPFGGQPFLAHVLTELADAGYEHVCLVTGPATVAVCEHFERVHARRLHIDFAVQDAPLGSAHALLAAERFGAGEDICVINADNLYPAAALRMLRGLDGSGLVGFRREGLLRGNIDMARIAAFAVVEHDGEGTLTGIVEKPDAATLAAAGPEALVSMTCWRFSAGIFAAIRETRQSVRDEYELPDAVRSALRRERFEVVAMNVAVLDLSVREDIPRVELLLRGRHVDL